MSVDSAYMTGSSEYSKWNALKTNIDELKQKHNAVILAHYYQDPIIQDIADFVGDSLDLSRKAANTDADVIVFCGVHFMAETAKILSPNKKVLIPDVDAGCTLADDCPPERFSQFLAKYPDHYVVSYINCSAAVKAQSDLICTSSNAVDLINQLPKDKSIIFAPDQNLGKWVQNQCGRELTLWPGSCSVHESFSEEELIRLSLENPEAEVIAHPECQENLLNMASYIGSTSKLLQRVETSPSESFIVLTEPGIIHQMKRLQPHKSFYDVPGLDGCSCNECPYMRLNTIDKVHDCLKNLSPLIEIDDTIINRAYEPIKLMLDMSK